MVAGSSGIGYNNGKEVTMQYEEGIYACAPSNGDNAQYIIHFDAHSEQNTYRYVTTYGERHTGISVRLVRDINKSDNEAIHPVNTDNAQCTKILRNGQLFIIRDGRMYTIQGQEIK